MKQIHLYKTVLDEHGKIHKQLIGTYDSVESIPDEAMKVADLLIESNEHGESSYRGADL